MRTVVARTALIWGVMLPVSLIAVEIKAQITLTIDSPGSEPDANPGDGVCATARGGCTPRAALMEARALIQGDVAIGNSEGSSGVRPRIVSVVSTADLLAAADQSPSAAIFTVDCTADAHDASPGDGICATAAGECTLRAAIEEANALLGQQTVQVPPGTYLLALGALNVSDDLVLQGAGAGHTIIDGGMADNVISVSGPGVQLEVDDLQVANGVEGIEATISTELLVSRSAITDSQGAGISAPVSVVAISRSQITGNGVGISSVPSGAVMIDSSMIAGNRGLGVYGSEAGISITNSTIDENRGGGLFVDGNDFVMSNSTVSNNVSAGDGGGIWLNARSRITNSTISGNTAGGRAGGLWFENGFNGGAGAVVGGDVYLNNVTLTHNTAAQGGGIVGQSGGGPQSANQYYPAHAYVRNSIIAPNSASDSAPDCLSLPDTNRLGDVVTTDLLVFLGHNLIGDGSDCAFTADPSDRIGTAMSPVDPLIGPLGNNFGPTLTRGLLRGSPALDAVPIADCAYDDDGDPSTPDVPLPTDQRGILRPLGGACDIGAFEGLAPACDDGVDNDGDGLIDFPADPQCKASWYNSESESCGLGAELALVLPALMWLCAKRTQRSA